METFIYEFLSYSYIILYEERTMSTETLTNEPGALAETVPKFKRETIQHSDEITQDRITDKSLRGKWFYTADSGLYTNEGNNVLPVSFARVDHNLIFQNLGEATQQLIHTGNYRPTKEDAQRVRDALSTLTVNLSDLDLQSHSDEFSFYTVVPAKTENLNPSQLVVAQRAFGYGDRFEGAMEIFDEDDRTKEGVRVYVLNPNYVTKNAKVGESLVRAGRLGTFGDRSRFGADGRGVGNPNGHVRGVIAGGEDAQQPTLEPIVQAYETLQENPRQAEEHAPKYIETLAGLVHSAVQEKKS